MTQKKRQHKIDNNNMTKKLFRSNTNKIFQIYDTSVSMLLIFLNSHNNISNHHLALKPCVRLSVHKFLTSIFKNGDRFTQYTLYMYNVHEYS